MSKNTNVSLRSSRLASPIGRSKAIAQIGRIHLSGFAAWMMWLLIHLVFLVGLRNRFSVFVSWIYSYFTYRRGARIIMGEEITRPPAG